MATHSTENNLNSVICNLCFLQEDSGRHLKGLIRPILSMSEYLLIICFQTLFFNLLLFFLPNAGHASVLSTLRSVKHPPSHSPAFDLITAKLKYPISCSKPSRSWTDEGADHRGVRALHRFTLATGSRWGLLSNLESPS